MRRHTISSNTRSCLSRRRGFEECFRCQAFINYLKLLETPRLLRLRPAVEKMWWDKKKNSSISISCCPQNMSAENRKKKCQDVNNKFVTAGSLSKEHSQQMSAAVNYWFQDLTFQHPKTLTAPVSQSLSQFLSHRQFFNPECQIFSCDRQLFQFW